MWKQKTLISALVLAALSLGAVTVINLATQVTGLLAKTNGGTGISSTATYPSSGTVSVTVISGTSAMTAATITTASCQTAVTTAATGAATTDAIQWAYNAAPSGTTDARLTIAPYVTSGNVNFTRCNPTAASIVGTAITINWRIVR